ncbi:MAG: protein jag [Pseudobdellovibrionaceae bacterium]|jgi:spoIIIJ-associated protein
MAGFFSKIFGGKKSPAKTAQDLVESTLEGLIEKGRFDLTYEIEVNGNGENPEMKINLMGEDEELLKDRKGQVLDAVQLFLKRVLQHNFPEDRTQISIDCGGYRDESQQALIERAESLKVIVIEQGKSVYYRALPPRERKIVHQYLSQDPRVKSRSLGEGLYKKIKIYPAKSTAPNEV